MKCSSPKGYPAVTAMTRFRRKFSPGATEKMPLGAPFPAALAASPATASNWNRNAQHEERAHSEAVPDTLVDHILSFAVRTLRSLFLLCRPSRGFQTVLRQA